MFRFSRAWAAILPALVCCFAVGCGGVKTYRVSGKVTFKGQPVPAGKIYFMPDTAKGNTGQGGYADIKDGQYDTSATGGKGAPGGPVMVWIEGRDPSSKPDKVDKDDKAGEITVKSLFPKYEVAADLPKEDTTKDFEVPAGAASGPPKKDPKFVEP